MQQARINDADSRPARELRCRRSTAVRVAPLVLNVMLIVGASASVCAAGAEHQVAPVAVSQQGSANAWKLLRNLRTLAESCELVRTDRWNELSLVRALEAQSIVWEARTETELRGRLVGNIGSRPQPPTANPEPVRVRFAQRLDRKPFAGVIWANFAPDDALNFSAVVKEFGDGWKFGLGYRLPRPKTQYASDVYGNIVIEYGHSCPHGQMRWRLEFAGDSTLDRVVMDWN